MKREVNAGTRCEVTGTVYVDGEDFPAGAVEVMNAAGPPTMFGPKP